MPSEEELDRWIDATLADYAEVRPLCGLEERVWNRIRTAAPKRAWYAYLGWSTVAAALAVALWITIPAEKSKPAQRIVSSTPSAKPKIAPPIQILAAFKPTRKIRKRVPELPKLQQFPAPQSITAQERALLALAQNHPVEMRQTFAGLASQMNSPLEIEPIQITPIPTKGEEEKYEN